MSLETPLHRVQGLGSAHSGVRHFWRERVTAAALIPLSVWFVASAALLGGKTEAEVAGYLQHPWNALIMGLFVIVICVHMMLGLQVVIDDYVHHPGQRIALLLLNRAFTWVVGGLSLVALARLAVG
ncbi:MAG: succinate dehydrogenase, hydrophobic membrane anchor protein [Alphaproteobacteria bacterium]|nr:succinate dehydrogenase, hydrophobic membrane anchor protein [Alphaproteobacteria bacterium]MBV9063751.1 succinate dehydrogenase, hydrophobic membrane anchor protein [Alphaproteobacteria bacterium]